MKVKIKKEGKVKEFKLISKWEDVTLEKWLKLIDFKQGSKSKEAQKTIAALSNIPKDLINQLELKDVAVIMSKLADLQAEQNSSLKRIIKIDGKRYGFHPNFDELTLGEYADLETLIKNGVDNNMPKLMAILYRPIVEEKNDVYTIEAYDGEISMRAEEMKKMLAEQVQSALIFFYTLGKELSMTLPLYSMEQLKEMKQQLPLNPSQKNGVGLG